MPEMLKIGCAPGRGHGLGVKEIADDQAVDQSGADICQLDQRKGDEHGVKALIQHQPALGLLHGKQSHGFQQL